MRRLAALASSNANEHSSPSALAGRGGFAVRRKRWGHSATPSASKTRHLPRDATGEKCRLLVTSDSLPATRDGRPEVSS